MLKLILLMSMVLITPLSAQQGTIPASLPSISIGSRGEVKVTPDRATLRISVQTKAPTAAAAATQNATRQKAVIDALRAMGIPSDKISTTGYNVMPEHRYEQNREPVILGYTVVNTVSVEVTDLAMIGRIIDTSISRGANMISSLSFYAANTEAARREAIAMAIRSARLDADAAARAAGGSVGGLLEVSVGAYFPPPRPYDMAAQVQLRSTVAADTPIQPGDQTLMVNVSTRWSFIGGRN